MPLLFSLAIHNALEEVRGQMQDDDLFFAFLDDNLIVSSPERTIQTRLHRMAGDAKTRVWNRAGVRPPDVADLGEEVWSPRGVKILRTPVGSPEVVHALAMVRLQQERVLWEAIDWVQDFATRVANSGANALGPRVTIVSARCHQVSRTRTLKPTRHRHDGDTAPSFWTV